MWKQPETLMIAIAAASLWCATSPAGQFEPLFRLTKVEGLCQVQRPMMQKAQPAKDGKAYPYGSRIEIPHDGSAVVLLANRNLGVLGPDTIVTISEGADGTKRFELEKGKLKVRSDEEAGGELLRVITGMTECDSLEGTVTFTYASDLTEHQQTVTSSSGNVRIKGKQYVVPSLQKNASILIRTALDRSLTRLSNAAGEYIIQLASGDETPVDVETHKRSLIKIWRKHAEVGGRLIVSVLVTHADSTMSESFAYRDGIGISEFYGRTKSDVPSEESIIPGLDETDTEGDAALAPEIDTGGTAPAPDPFSQDADPFSNM